MKPINEMDNREIVDIICSLDMRKKEIDTDIKQLQAELQKRGLSVLEERNIKQTEFFGGNTNKADVTYSQSLDIINYFRLKEVCGEILDEYVTRKPEIKYEIKKQFKDVLIAIFTGEYEPDITVDEILINCFALDFKQKSLLLKKLKGNYKSDKSAILSVLGKSENETDIDLELDFIYRAKNWEKIKMFFNDSDPETMLGMIKKCIVVESTVKIGIKYDDSEERDVG